MKTYIKTTQMRKLALLLLLFTGMVNAQIFFIPDANFRAKLLAADVTNNIAYGISTVAGSGNSIKIDSNNDGQIQFSEVQLVGALHISNFGSPISSNISDLSGIESFTNLKYLECSGNSLTSLNLNNNVQLEILYCENNQLINLNISNNSVLTQLTCNNNQLTNLYVSNNSALTYLWCYSNQLTNLDVSNNIALTSLGCANNFLTNLNISSNLTLDTLNCSVNQLLNLNTSNNNLLWRLYCDNNQLTSLNVNSNISLDYLKCSNNQLTSLNMSNNLGLVQLECQNNLLTSLFIKNGKDETTLNFSNNPNLQYICADDAQLTDVQTKINTYGYTSTCSVSSYCTFTPGGNYNTISGNVKYDTDNNGCDANDLAQPSIRVNINDGTNTGASYTNTTGDYNFYTQAGSFAITPEVENPTWFNFTPATATIPFADNNNNTATQDFCITPNGIHPDLEVVLAPITPARPGFDATYQLVYKNKGNQTLNGVVSLNYDVFRLLFTYSNTTPDFNFEGTIDWNFTNLLPFESRSISVTFNVNSPVETPAVNIGDVLNFTTSITPIAGDELPNDNTFVYNQTVVGSFDPNDITCIEGNSVAPSEIGKYLHYVINFENTGNFPAENVVVKTVVDPAKFDINSLQLLNTSNPVDARITGNSVEFIFKNIQLGGPGGHGHVLLKVKSKSTLVTGDTVAKRADIFFDYNAPVDTGMATTVFQSLSNAVFEKDNSIGISPNPTNGNFNVNSNFNIKSIELYDVQGRIIETHIGETNTLDISDKANGIYFLKITTEKGSKIEKVAKK